MSLPQEHTRDTSRAFIASLERLAPKDTDRGQDESRKRAALATLRRGLGKPAGSVVDMYRYIGSDLPSEPDREGAYFLVAGLFAMHPRHWSPEESGLHDNMGTSFRLLCQRLRQANKSVDGLEKRFTALLDASSDTLENHLRHGISLMHTEDVPVNYLCLLRDIQNWSWDDRSVQRRWARAYWTGGTASETADVASKTATIDSTSK